MQIILMLRVNCSLFCGKLCINMSYELRFNPLNAELSPICHLLALFGAHHILQVSRIRVNRLCMTYLTYTENKFYVMHTVINSYTRVIPKVMTHEQLRIVGNSATSND